MSMHRRPCQFCLAMLQTPDKRCRLRYDRRNATVVGLRYPARHITNDSRQLRDRGAMFRILRIAEAAGYIHEDFYQRCHGMPTMALPIVVRLVHGWKVIDRIGHTHSPRVNHHRLAAKVVFRRL